MKTLAVVSRTGGVPESTAPCMLQYSFKPENIDEIVASLKRICQLTVQEMEDMGRDGRAFALQRYDIRNLNHQLLTLIDEHSRTRKQGNRHQTA